MFGKKDDGPLCGFDKRPCIKERCVQWVHIRGKHPQTGAAVDMPDCSFKWLPVLLIENAQETRQAAAAVESQRNAVAGIAIAAVAEVVERMAASSPALQGDARGRLGRPN